MKRNNVSFNYLDKKRQPKACILFNLNKLIKCLRFVYKKSLWLPTLYDTKYCKLSCIEMYKRTNFDTTLKLKSIIKIELYVLL